jgi:hypothetical protein
MYHMQVDMLSTGYTLVSPASMLEQCIITKVSKIIFNLQLHNSKG